MRAEKVITLPNGVDPEDYEGLAAKALWPQTDRAVILHAGSVYSKRNPITLLQCLSVLKKSGSHFHFFFSSEHLMSQLEQS